MDIIARTKSDLTPTLTEPLRQRLEIGIQLRSCRSSATFGHSLLVIMPIVSKIRIWESRLVFPVTLTGEDMSYSTFIYKYSSLQILQTFVIGISLSGLEIHGGIDIPRSQMSN
jgi:hypothetical protein